MNKKVTVIYRYCIMSAYPPPTLNNGVLNQIYNSLDYDSTSPKFLKLSGGAITGDLTISGNIDANDVESSGTVRLNSITPIYSSLPTYTSSQIGYTIQKVLSTESTYHTGIRNVPTGADTLNIPIGVYLVNHTFQLNVTINNTKRKNITLIPVSGMTVVDYSVGYGDMGLAATQEYYYNHIPYVIRVTSNSNSVRASVKSEGNLRLQASRLTFLRIA